MKNKMNFSRWYQKYMNKWIPRYGFFSLIACLFINGMMYSGTQLVMKNTYHYDFTSNLDRKVPFIKEWAVIYLGCYAFWVINYILICREGKEKWYRFACADIISRLVCGAFFILLPTTNTRPTVLGDDFFSWLVQYVYQKDLPTNLFPSIHCLVSWFCYIGIRKNNKIPSWYKVFSCIFALLVCASTQFIKQHYLIDVAGGILLAEICYYIANHTQIYVLFGKNFDWIGQKIFGESYYNKEESK